MKSGKVSLLGGIAAAAMLFAGQSSTNAAMYSSIAGGNFTVSDISDSNGAYGQPTIDSSGKLTFTNLNFGVVASSAGGSSGVTARLTFKVTLNEGTGVPSAHLSEFGTRQTLGTGGSVGIFPYIALFSDPLTAPLTPLESKTGDINFISPTEWNTDVSVKGTDAVSSFWVVVDNDILTLANVGGSVAVDKKIILIDLDGNETGGGGTTPEPASLGILSLGTLALLNRRRK